MNRRRLLAAILAAVSTGCARAPSGSVSLAAATPLATPPLSSAVSAAAVSVTQDLPDSSGVYQVGGSVTEPVEVSRVAPRLPPPERYLNPRIPSRVYVYRCVITETGTVGRLHLLRGPADGDPDGSFDRAMQEAIRQWRYRPATLHGRPVPAWLTITITDRTASTAGPNPGVQRTRFARR